MMGLQTEQLSLLDSGQTTIQAISRSLPFFVNEAHARTNGASVADNRSGQNSSQDKHSFAASK
jgi:hypothetical protein